MEGHNLYHPHRKMIFVRSVDLGKELVDRDVDNYYVERRFDLCIRGLSMEEGLQDRLDDGDHCLQMSMMA
jgi:hypothetical protein